jgi:hypothetical protein
MAIKTMKKTTSASGNSVRSSLGHASSSPATKRAVKAIQAEMRAAGINPVVTRS